jgi:CheY-like chemotaxis protein
MTATVVVVDDNAANVLLVQRILDRLPDLEVLSESDGQRGLELIRQRQPDLVLLDLNLPSIDGEGILAALRADPGTSRIPVVIMSGDAIPETARRLQAAGAAMFIAKPFELATLLDTVNVLLDRGR